MNRRYIATGVLIVLSIPAVPLLRTTSERLTGMDVPIVVLVQVGSSTQ